MICSFAAVPYKTTIMTTLILQGPHLTGEQANELAHVLDGQSSPGTDCWRITTDKTVSQALLQDLREQADFDINCWPANFRPAAIRLLISDMDSTLINIECVDEIADFTGRKKEVAAITAAAMRGEINFESSLQQRVALLRDIPTAALEQVYRERLRLNPGAENLLAELRRRDIKTALVSGGFTVFTQRLQQRLQLDYSLANQLEIRDGRLSGQINGAIVGARRKADFLRELCRQLEIETAQAIAVGDGANDLEMMRLAGLSIAYHAKPAVQAEADIALNYSGLDAIIAWLA